MRSWIIWRRGAVSLEACDYGQDYNSQTAMALLREGFRSSMRILFGVLVYAISLYAGALPELPKVNTTNFLPSIRAQIDRATAEANAHPRDIRAVTALAM